MCESCRLADSSSWFRAASEASAVRVVHQSLYCLIECCQSSCGSATASRLDARDHQRPSFEKTGAEAQYETCGWVLIYFFIQLSADPKKWWTNIWGSWHFARPSRSTLNFLWKRGQQVFVACMRTALSLLSPCLTLNPLMSLGSRLDCSC